MLCAHFQWDEKIFFFILRMKLCRLNSIKKKSTFFLTRDNSKCRNSIIITEYIFREYILRKNKKTVNPIIMYTLVCMCVCVKYQPQMIYAIWKHITPVDLIFLKYRIRYIPPLSKYWNLTSAKLLYYYALNLNETESISIGNFFFFSIEFIKDTSWR